MLARRGMTVVGVAADSRHWAARTRVVQRVVEVDHTSPERLIEALCNEHSASFADGSILLPCTDTSVLAVAAEADRLRRRYRFAEPPRASIESLLDKSSFAAVAAAAGTPTASSVEIDSAERLDVAVAHLRAPCVVKPARKDRRWLRSAPDKAIRVDSTDDLVPTVAAALAWSDHLVVQEWVDGPDTDLVTCNCYIDPTGAVRASVVSSKLRQWPPEVGTGSSAVTVEDPMVADATARILTSVGFTGLGYVEFKRRHGTGELVAIEANVGRPTGRSVMAEAAGVELHHAFCADLAGLGRPRLGESVPGVVWVHLRRDLQAAFRQWRRRESTPIDWARSLRGPRAYAVADWTDPLPFLLDLTTVVRKRLPKAPPRRAQRSEGPESGTHHLQEQPS